MYNIKIQYFWQSILRLFNHCTESYNFGMKKGSVFIKLIISASSYIPKFKHNKPENLKLQIFSTNPTTIPPGDPTR